MQPEKTANILWYHHCFPCNITSAERSQIQYWWCLTTHWVVLLIGRAAKEISFNQSEVLPRSDLLCNLGTPWQSIGWQINWLVDQTPSTRGWVLVDMRLSILTNMLASVSADTWRKRRLTWVLVECQLICWLVCWLTLHLYLVGMLVET